MNDHVRGWWKYTFQGPTSNLLTRAQKQPVVVSSKTETRFESRDTEKLAKPCDRPVCVEMKESLVTGERLCWERVLEAVSVQRD